MSATVIRGDARHLPLPDSSVDLIVTSPPYFALRSYQDQGEHYRGQIGSEPTPAEFLDALIVCTREMMRVLKPSGSIWLNLGDKYNSAASGQNGLGKSSLGASKGEANRQCAIRYGEALNASRGGTVADVRLKSLIGLPWRYALRCIDELGLILRAEVIWSKPNGLPESVTDRVRRSHEQWFHFTVRPRYYAAVDTIREPHESIRPGAGGLTGGSYATQRDDGALGKALTSVNPLGKLPSSVWEIKEDSFSLVRGVLLAIHTGNLTVDEGERILTGAAWTGYNDSGPTSTRPVNAGSGQADAHQRAMESFGSTERPSAHTASPTHSPTASSPNGAIISTTSVGSLAASDPNTSSPLPSAKTSCEDQPLWPHGTQPKPIASTGTSSATPTPTGHETDSACAENASERATAAPTGARKAAPPPDSVIPAQPLISAESAAIPQPTSSFFSPGSVWSIPSQPLSIPAWVGVDHFAAFPMEWPRRLILGWSPSGICAGCGEGRRPVSEKALELTQGPAIVNRYLSREDEYIHNWKGNKAQTGRTVATLTGEVCACPDLTAPTRPAVILDPFGGTGTVALMADVLGRHGITVDMSADYCRAARWRTTDPGERARAMQVEKPEPVPDGQLGLFEGVL